MLDGKSVNAIEGVKMTQMCYICKATTKNMNDINRRNITANLSNVDILKYGLSPLHARIKFMEFILKLAYRLDLPIEKRHKGIRLSPLEKEIVEKRKRKIQNDFESKLNLMVDVPKQGFGSSNDGNSARRFFVNSDLRSEITGIQRDIIYKFHIVLIAITSSHSIDPEAFGNYTLDLINILLKNYNWWPMSPTVHKVLMHGHEIISRAILPIGQLSEEAQEHRNKDYKKFKSNFARRCSRINNLKDIFNRFLVTSDPFMSHLRESTKMKKNFKDMPEDVKKLMKVNSSSRNTSEIEEYETDDEII